MGLTIDISPCSGNLHNATHCWQAGRVARGLSCCTAELLLLPTAALGLFCIASNLWPHHLLHWLTLLGILMDVPVEKPLKRAVVVVLPVLPVLYGLDFCRAERG
jgi:hypothetical protein